MTYYSVQALTLISCPRCGIYEQWVEICVTTSFRGALILRQTESRQTRVFRITKEQVA